MRFTYLTFQIIITIRSWKHVWEIDRPSPSISPPLLHTSRYNVGPSNIYTRVSSLPFFPTLAEFYRDIITARSSLLIEHSSLLHNISKNEFFRIIWSFEFTSYGNILRSCLRRIRMNYQTAGLFVIRRSLVQMKIKPFPQCV